MDIHALHARTVKHCKKCSGTGAVLQDNVFVDCSCMLEFKSKLALVRSCIPTKFHKFTLRNLTKDFRTQNETALQIVRKYAEFVQENVEQGYGLFFQARPGLGKTALACYTMMRALDAGLKARFIRYSDLISMMFKALDDDGVNQELDYLRECQMVCIDRIDHGYLQVDSNYAKDRLDDLFSHWHSNEVSLLVTSNTAREQLTGFPFAYVLSDLIDVVFVGESFRGDVNALQAVMSRTKTKGQDD